jgi:hypothetical protein
MEEKKRATKIVELKKKTKCRKCGKKGHWEREFLDYKKEGDFEKLGSKGVNIKKSEAHSMISEELKEGENSTFMAHTKEYPCDDAWYMDDNAINGTYQPINA